MADYVELRGVRTWYDEHGEGDPLVLLHPGGADAQAWGPNLEALAAHFHVDRVPRERGRLQRRREPRSLGRAAPPGPTLAPSDLSGVKGRTLVMLGDDDEVTLEHAIAMYRALPEAELAVVPGTSHGLLHEKPALCNSMLVDFLTTDPVPTIAPVRRAAG